MAPGKNETRELFIKVSDKLFFQNGYENVSVDEICQEAGKAKGLFFYYFEKKENVVKILLEMQVERMSRVLLRRLADDENHIEKMNTIMQSLFDTEKGAPRAMYYFKTRPLPGWADSFAHELKDKYIFPLIRDVASEGASVGVFKESDDIQAEIIFLGISQFMHRHFSQMDEIGYAAKSMAAITRVLEKALGCPKGSIKLIKE